MRPILITLCLLSMTVAGCQSSASSHLRRLDDLKAELSAVGPVEVTHPAPDRVVLRVDVREAVTVAWDHEGRRLAIATREAVRIIAPSDAGQPERQAMFEPLEAPPRLLWLADGRLWIAPDRGGLEAPFEIEQPPAIDDVVMAVGPAGRGLLAQAPGGWRFAVRSGDRWAIRALPWTLASPKAAPADDAPPWDVAASPVALLGDALLVPAPDGLRVIGAEGESTLPWPRSVGRPRDIWSGAGRVCIGFPEGRMVVTAVDAPLRFEPGDARAAVWPGSVVDGCVGAEGAALVVDGGGARLQGDQGSTPLDADAVTAVIDPTGSRWATVRHDGVYVGAVGAAGRRVVAAPAPTAAEVTGVIEREGEVLVMEVDPALRARVPGLDLGPLPEPLALTIGREALMYAGGAALLVGLIVAQPALHDALSCCFGNPP